MLAKAFSIVATGFENTYDKGGHPYAIHCIRVMNNLHSDDPELKAAALLHDCIEDGVITSQELFEAGFSPRVVQTVCLLTHQKSIKYDDYIRLIGTSRDATAIKIADLRDNSDITRLKGITEKDIARMEKYHKAYLYLTGLYK